VTYQINTLLSVNFKC